MPDDARLTPAVEVLAAAEAAARDRDTIAAGTPSRALMQRAAAAAAGEVTRRYGARAARRGVAVFAGTGNNGGDGWAVAGMLARVGLRVWVAATGDPRTDDARAERANALPLLEPGEPPAGVGVVVDAVLGIGATGRPTGAAEGAIARIAAARQGGAAVVALDVPSGVDADTGDSEGSVVADLTVTFGALKRGLLVARARVGTVVAVDIGFAPGADLATPRLVDAGWVRRALPPIAADAHKSTRRHLAVVGGGAGMAGAAILAVRAALASGAGMVKGVLAAESVPALQGAVVAALAAGWPADADGVDGAFGKWAHALLIGPGLGRSERTRHLVEDALTRFRGPVVLDADALTLFEGQAAALARQLAGRPALVTPHVAEFARLAGGTAADALARRYDAGAALARELGAVVLLKGVPTVITAPDGRRLVSATGTPALATGGSGDVLGGIAATLLAQTGDPFVAAGCAAWVHGRAAELASAGRTVRGVTLETVLAALPDAWILDAPRPRYPVLAVVPSVGGDGAAEG